MYFTPILKFFNYYNIFSAGLSPGSSHGTSLASRASSAEGTPAHLTPFSTKRLDREFERKLQEVFVSVQLEKVRKGLTSDGKEIENLKYISLSEIGARPKILTVSKLLSN